MASSPTQRTLKYYRAGGWECQVTEKWNQFAKIRQDLFGFIDVLGIREGRILGIQSTSYSNHSARRNKILGLPKAEKWLKSGGEIVISSWKKKPNGRYEHREEFITLDYFKEQQDENNTQG